MGSKESGLASPRRRPLSGEEFRSTYSKVPRLCVEVVVKTDAGVVLLVRKEASWKGQWHIPGGTVFYQEPLETAVERVAQEELGIEVNIEKLIGYIEYPSEVKERGFGWAVGIAFLCTPASDVDSAAWEKADIKVFQELPDNLIEEQRPILEQALAAAV